MRHTKSNPQQIRHLLVWHNLRIVNSGYINTICFCHKPTSPFAYCLFATSLTLSAQIIQTPHPNTSTLLDRNIISLRLQSSVSPHSSLHKPPFTQKPATPYPIRTNLPSLHRNPSPTTNTPNSPPNPPFVLTHYSPPRHSSIDDNNKP
jgi:hypothetical protein